MQNADELKRNIRESVRVLGTYTLRRREVPIKLNQNESPLDLPAALKAEVVARVEGMAWNRYPDFHPEDVLAALGARHGLPPEGVLIGNGSNELLQAIFQAIAGPGVRVALPVPTFTLYASMVRANGAEVEEVPLDAATLGYDVAALERIAAQGEAHLLICNPNNPTGAALAAAQIEALARATPRLVIVDEAYVHFAAAEVSSEGLLGRCPNVILLRTLSKALGLAGVRFGYAAGHPAIMEEIGKLKLPYNVGHFGLEVVRATLRDMSWLAPQVALLRAERDRVAAGLGALGLEVFSGQANFTLVRCRDHVALFEGLLAAGILVRDVSHYPLLARCLRITVGTPAENDAVLAAAARVLGGM